MQNSRFPFTSRHIYMDKTRLDTNCYFSNYQTSIFLSIPKQVDKNIPPSLFRDCNNHYRIRIIRQFFQCRKFSFSAASVIFFQPGHHFSGINNHSIFSCALHALGRKAIKPVRSSFIPSFSAYIRVVFAFRS